MISYVFFFSFVKPELRFSFCCLEGKEGSCLNWVFLPALFFKCPLTKQLKSFLVENKNFFFPFLFLVKLEALVSRETLKMSEDLKQAKRKTKTV